MSELKAYAVGDMDIYAATSKQEALGLANEAHSCSGYEEPTFEIDEVIELVDSDLDKEYPEFDEDEHPTGGVTTIRIWLSETVTSGWLCGSDW